MAYGETPGILSSDTARPWGERVREWRSTRGLSVTQLTALLKVSRPTLENWEAGVRSPKIETDYVQRFRTLQVEAGESPGFDSPSRVRWLWQTHLQTGKPSRRRTRAA